MQEFYNMEEKYSRKILFRVNGTYCKLQRDTWHVTPIADYLIVLREDAKLFENRRT